MPIEQSCFLTTSAYDEKLPITNGFTLDFYQHQLILFVVKSQLFANTNNAFLVTEAPGYINVYSKYPESSDKNVCTYNEFRVLVFNKNNQPITSVTSGVNGFVIKLIKQDGAYSIYSLTFPQLNANTGVYSPSFVAHTTSATYNFAISFRCLIPDYQSVNVYQSQPAPRKNGLDYCTTLEVTGLTFSLLQLVTTDGRKFKGVKNQFCIDWSREYIETPLSDYSLTFVFDIKQVSIASSSAFNALSETDSISNKIIYPEYDGGILKEVGYGLTPLLTVKCNSYLNIPYQYLEFSPDNVIVESFPIYGTKGNLTFIISSVGKQLLVDPMAVTSRLKFYNRPSGINDPLVEIHISSYPLTSINSFSVFDEIPDEEYYYFRHQFDQLELNSNIYDLNYGGSIITLSWPLGFTFGTNANCTNHFVIQKSQLSVLPSRQYCVDTYPYKLNVNCFTVQSSGASQSPTVISSYEFIKILDSIYILRISIQDLAGISLIKSPFFISSTNYLDSLVKGSIFDGLYEFIVDIFLDPTVTIISLFEQTTVLKLGDYIRLQPTVLQYNLPLVLSNSIYNSNSIGSISFTDNNLNLQNDNSYNYISFKSDDFSIDRPMNFVLQDPISYNSKTGKSTRWPIVYNSTTDLFTAKFVLGKNNLFGPIDYLIEIAPNTFISSTEYAYSSSQLIVEKTYLDNYGPIFTDIFIRSNTIEDWAIVGMDFIIKDDYSGFKNGIITLTGSVDNSIYNFTFKYSDLVDDLISLNINTTSPCITQVYQVTFVQLFDNNGIESRFEIMPKSQIPQPTTNPFINFLSKYEKYVIPFTCSGLIDPTPPTLVSFKSSVSTIDVGASSRSITFEFEAQDIESGLKNGQYPTVYLTTNKMEIAQCKSSIYSISSTNAKYHCFVKLPYGFGNGRDVLVSVYGFINNGGYFSGFDNQYLSVNFNSYYKITTTFTLNFQPLISSNKPLTSLDDTLVLYGRSFNDTSKLSITYLDDPQGQLISITPTTIHPTVLIVQGIKQTTKPYIVSVLTNAGLSSAPYTVYPTFFNTTWTPLDIIITQTPTTTTTPTTSGSSIGGSSIGSSSSTTLNKCPGKPECGGSNQGNCVNGVCICFSPWVGNDCSSRVIIVPQPNTNTTDPSIEIPIINENNGDDILFKSLISIVSIRELDFNGNEIKSFTFDKWIYNEINSKNNQYTTNITTSSSSDQNVSTTNITVTLEWFDVVTIINFAESNLTMNPSTIKYTIEFTEYPFSSPLNQLQLILSALFESSKSIDICSSKEFGNISEGLDNYLKIQIDDHSLYGRFIKRAIVDNKVTTISNSLLDSSFNSISSASQSQSYVGISIPWFKSVAIIDPDFSVLVNSNPTSNNDENSTCNFKSNKLSNSQLAGIIIGTIAFVAVITISAVYFYIKKKKDGKFLLSMGRKLKNMN